MRSVYLFIRPRRRLLSWRWMAIAGAMAILAVVAAPKLADSSLGRAFGANHPASIATLQLPPSIADVDCTDLKAQTEAQAFFASKGHGDPPRLDRDHGGRACERLP